MFHAQLVLFCLLLALCSCHVRHVGSCPYTSNPMHDFNPAKLMGRWYVRMSFDDDMTCGIINYDDCGLDCLRVIESRNIYLMSALQLRSNYVNDGILKMNIGQPSRMTAKFSIYTPNADYVVLYTDYEHVAIVFTCQNIGASSLFTLFHRRNVYVMTRSLQQPVDERLRKMVTDVLTDNHIENELVDTNQERCQIISNSSWNINATEIGQNMRHVAGNISKGISTLFSTVKDVVSGSSADPAASGVQPFD